MTGEWYLSEVNFEEDSFLSIQVAFLGIDLGYPDDYLGLDVVFEYDAENDQFILDGVNSSSI